MTLNNKFDPRLKETPDLPGEIYDEHFFCSYCHEEIPLDQMQHSRVCDDDQPLCGGCADHLEAMWELQYEALQEEQDGIDS
jgi:formylmethanofuran dehydrogenase subunit E